MTLPGCGLKNTLTFLYDTEVLDISARISTYDIESEAMPELAYFKVKSGFKDFDYEEINGRGEYNTEALHTTIIETDTEFDNVCRI